MNELPIVLVKNRYVIYIAITILKLMCSTSQLIVVFMAFKELVICRSAIKLSEVKYVTVLVSDLQAQPLLYATFERSDCK